MTRDELGKELRAFGARAEAHGHDAAAVVLVALSALVYVGAEMGLALIARQMVKNLGDALRGAGVAVSPEMQAEQDRIVRENDPLINDWSNWEKHDDG